MEIGSKSVDIQNQKVVFYDGVCGLCNQTVQLLLRLDKKEILHFAMLQNESSRSYLGSFGIDSTQLESFVYSRNGKVYTKSSAALTVFKDVKWLGKLTYVFMLIPPFIRNAVYDWISRNRYKWFGKSESCEIPRPDVRQRFLFE